MTKPRNYLVKGLILAMCCLALCVFMPVCSLGQTVLLKGKVVDESTHSPLPDCQVVVKDSGDMVLAFVHTNSSGRYEIAIDDSSELAGGSISVSLVGYLAKKGNFLAGIYTYDFALSAGNDQLPEVIVKGLKPVTRTGDTISYNVQFFADSSDRSIGDVLKKIPGVSVDESGRIAYNGKAISNLYIHGDDLMSGRYGAATKAIRKEQIKSIDILLNYQPINVLRDKVLTDKTAINLTLTDPKRLSPAGLGMLGAGLPGVYDAEGTAMLLNDNIKMLNGLKANNSGIDYANDIKNHNQSQFQEEQNFVENRALLNSALAGNPDIPHNYYYRNQSELINLNNLLKTKDSLQVKVNFNWHGDNSSFPFYAEVNNLLPDGDTVTFTQDQEAKSRLRNIDAGFSLQANKQRAYWHNKMNLQRLHTAENSKLSFNEDRFSQTLSTKHQRISNDFMFIPATSSQHLIELKWVANYQQMPQLLHIDKGVAPEMVNNGIDYKALRQQLRTPSYFSNASFGFIGTKPGKLTQSFELRHLAEHRQLQSEMDLLQDDNQYLPYAGDRGNAVSWRRQFMQAKAQINYRSDIWYASLELPLRYQTIHVEQPGFDDPPASKRLLFNPQAVLRYNVNLEDRITLRGGLSNNFGNIDQVYQGLMAVNFRTFNRNAPVVQESSMASVSLGYDLQRAIKLFSGNVQLQYDRRMANTMQAIVVDSNAQAAQTLALKNNQDAYTASGQLSYYITPIRTKATVNALWTNSFNNQVINGSPVKFANSVIMVNADLYGNLFQKLICRYTGSFLQASNQQREPKTDDQTINNRFTRMEHNAGLGFTFKHGMFSSGIRHTAFQDASLDPVRFTAADISTRYQLKKLKTDLSFDVSNVLNAKEYRVYTVSSNQFNVSTYPLRSRMAILKATFSF